MICQNCKKGFGLGTLILSLLLLILFPSKYLGAQSYINNCAFIELVVDTPYVEDAPLEPACYYKKVPIYFGATSDTVPDLFYAAEFTLTGLLTNGIITNIEYNFASATGLEYDDDSFDLHFYNALNTVNILTDYVIVTVETEPGAEFQLSVEATPFHLKNNFGQIITGVECDDLKPGANMVYKLYPSHPGVPDLPGPDPEECGSSSTTNPGLEFFVDVTNATYDGQTAELPIKMRNVHASDTITIIRADYRIDIEDVFGNLTIPSSINENGFTVLVAGNTILGRLTPSNPAVFILDSLATLPVGKITLEAPSNPITGGEAIFDFAYARVFIKDIFGPAGLDHCCKPPGIGDTLQVGSILPCQSPGEPLGFVQVKFAPSAFSTNQLTVPVYVENLTNPGNNVSTDGLTLEIQATTSGDLVLDSTAIANSLYGFPGCSGASIDIDTSAGTVSVEVTGSCGIAPGTNNLFKLFFTGTEGCVESIIATIAEFDPTGTYVACVPPIQPEKPLPCFHQGEVYFYCDTTVMIEGVQICKDSLGSGNSPDCSFSVSDCEETEITSSLGTYSVKGDINFLNYRIIPTKENDLNCGLSTIDLYFISRHIIGLDTLSADKRLAADVNQSGTISTVDIIQIRKIILATSTEFPDGPAWRFVPAEYEFPDTSLAIPSGYPE